MSHLVMQKHIPERPSNTKKSVYHNMKILLKITERNHIDKISNEKN